MSMIVAALVVVWSAVLMFEMGRVVENFRCASAEYGPLMTFGEHFRYSAIPTFNWWYVEATRWWDARFRTDDSPGFEPPWPPDDDDDADGIFCDSCGTFTTSCHTNRHGLVCDRCHELIATCELCDAVVERTTLQPVRISDYDRPGYSIAEACPACYARHTSYLGESDPSDPTPIHSLQS